jgi:hypothetical protein
MKEFKQKALIGLDDLSDDKYSIARLSRIDSINQNRNIKSCSDGGKIGGPIGGKTSKDKKLGFHAMSKEDRVKLSKEIGNRIGPRSHKEGFGMYGLSYEEKIAVAKYGGQQSIKSANHVNNRRLTCPHCNKEGGYTAMKRHHMDRCKHIK